MRRVAPLTLTLALAAALPAHAQHRQPPAPLAERVPAQVEARDPHAQHRQADAGDPHAGHDDRSPSADLLHEAHPAIEGSTSAPSPAPLPPPTAAERAAAFPDPASRAGQALHGMRMQDHMDDDPVLATLQFDRLEWQRAREASGMGWELQGWAGDLENRIWLRSEGERRHGATQHGDVELLWGRPTGPWWDMVAGIRHDLGDGPARDWIAFGVQGLAPYKFEVAATGYAGAGGRYAARAEAEYELLLTNRLVLQPRLEVNLYGKDDPEHGVGRGLSDAALGLRLRYELHRQFAPYVGHEWSRAFGRTADLATDAGEPRNDRMWVAGIRFWF